MLIERQISRFLVFSEDSIADALNKISKNQSGIVFAVTENGVLEGVLTDGDFRRWIVNCEQVQLDLPVATIINREYVSANEEENPELLVQRFDQRVQYLPLVDAHGRIVAIASSASGSFSIGRHVLSEEGPTFIIAEIGNNHNGNFELACRLIDAAANAGADCAKFQMRQLDTLYTNKGNPDDPSADLGAQYTLDLLASFQLSDEEMYRAFDYVRDKGMIPLCTPWDHRSVEKLEAYGMDAYKVSSADFTNHDLLQTLMDTGKPLICSTGMSDEYEIRQSIELLRSRGTKFVLMHCNSTYPAPFKDVNLAYLDNLRRNGYCMVGYSGHERGIFVPVAAVALGAKVIEKHFTLDKSMEGNDHKVSLLPEEFSRMVDGIRQIEQAMGGAGPRRLTQGEMMNREVLAKSLVASEPIKTGTQIKEHMVDVKSPGHGIQPNRKADLIGRTLRRDMKAGDVFFNSDLTVAGIQPRQYHFNRPWGVPVRYHDYRRFLDAVQPAFL
jgi:N-acetylneuraminate synthase